MATGEGQHRPSFDRSTVEGRQAEMAYLDSLGQAERDAYDRGHRYVTANPATTPEREARLAAQLADLKTAAANR